MLAGVADAQKKEAFLLLGHILKKDRTYMLLNENKELKEHEKFMRLIKRRQENEPLEYITNSAGFYSEDFYVDDRVLIPRPETEILVDKVLGICKKENITKIAEIGTGGGVISIMLAKLLGSAQITSTDISNKALEVAKINAEKFKVDKNINFINTSYLNGVDKNFDLLVSNPPYIANDFIVDKNLEFEPRSALFGGKKGDEILKNIIDIAIEKNVKYLVCEMGYDQKKALKEYFLKKGLRNFEFYKDLAEFDRGFCVKIKETT